jgi:hypothetical protein
MNKRMRGITSVSLLALAVAAAYPAAAWSADDLTGLRQEVEQLKREVRELRALVREQGQKAASKEEVKAVQSEVNKVATTRAGVALSSDSEVHLAGYGHVGFSSGRKDPIKQDTFSEVGFNPIFHYQYKDLLLFETELEIQANAEGEAEFGLEYANMNLFVNDYVTVFGGKFLTPVGYFIPNLHPAWINKFPSKPPGFQEEGGAAPVSDIGMGIRGGFPLGGAKANYVLYVGNGPRLELNGAGDEIESIIATGATVNPSNRKLIGGRFGILPIPHLELGVSGATSRVAVDTGAGIEPSRSYDVAGADVGYKWSGIGLRGEYIRSKVGDLATSVAPLGGTWKTWYAQGAYRIPGTNWEPVVRFAKFTSPHEDQSQKQRAIGLDYWFAPSVVGKVAYEFNSGMEGTANDADRLLLQFGYGF